MASLNPERRNEAYVALRELVEKIVIHPTGQYRPVDIEIHGRLAALLRCPEEADVPVSKKSVGRVVAGVGFEPTTFRL